MLSVLKSILHSALSPGASVMLTFVLPAIISVPSLHAQTTSSQNNKANTRTIEFSFPVVPHTTQYTVQIAKGNFNSVTDFTDHILQTRSADKNILSMDVLAEAGEYTWRIVYTTNGSVSAQSALYHFAVGMNPENAVNVKHVRIGTAADSSEQYPTVMRRLLYNKYFYTSIR